MEDVTSHQGVRPKEKILLIEEDCDGFGQFLIALKNSLTTENIRILSTALDFKPAERDKIERNEDPGHVFVHSLKEKGIINRSDISVLTEKLKFCGLYGVADDVKKLFERYLSRTKPDPNKSQDYEEKKTTFKKQLRIKYKRLCISLKPVPFLRDKYDIAELYVESGIKILKEKQKGGNEQEQSMTLNDYKAIFTKLSIESKRRIIEGQPGVGKSTLALRITNDWCNEMSPMNDVEVLILLRLRQFKNVPNIFAGIKKFLLPTDSSLTEDDIKSILYNSSTLVWLDGYDEYPDKGKEETDINYIIRGDMFQEHDVVITTRTSCLPPDCPPDAPQIRLTGFDNTARTTYIQNVVAHGNVEKAEKVSQFLRKNPVPEDICGLPLFFVMMAHMACERKAFQNLNTATEFFRHVVACFLSHEQLRETASNERKSEGLFTDHSKLDKVAFEGLIGDSQQITWDKNELRDKIGDEFYDEYVRVGILFEEEVFDVDAIDYKTETRFFHKLFHEWFAAHYLAKEAVLPETEFEAWPTTKFGYWLGIRKQAANRLQDETAASENAHMLKNLDPYSEQYMYRFACGLNSDAGTKIIEHLGKNENFDKWILLCISEWGGCLEKILQTVTGCVHE